MTIIVDGSPVRAFSEETVAVAAMAADLTTLSRSPKYHRPRGAFCFDGGCNGCLMRIDGLPNQRACMTRCREGLEVESQNAFPSAERDLLGAVDWIFAKGMDHHTFLTSSQTLNRMSQKIVRRLTGLGTLPDHARSAEPMPPVREVDVLILGGGPAGLSAARCAAELGATTLLFDQGLRLGGRLLTCPEQGLEAAAELARLAREAGAECQCEATAIGYFADEGPETGVFAIATADALVRVRAHAVVHAQGSYAQNMTFGDNDRPGVVAIRALGRLLTEYGLQPADVICVVGDAEPARSVMDHLQKLGATVRHVDGKEERVLAAAGGKHLTGLVIATGDGERHIDCGLIAIAEKGAPASELARQHGASVQFRTELGGFAVVVDGQARSADSAFACGDVCGYGSIEDARASGERAGRAAAEHALRHGAQL